jgi:hypothetical protein
MRVQTSLHKVRAQAGTTEYRDTEQTVQVLEADVYAFSNGQVSILVPATVTD